MPSERAAQAEQSDLFLSDDERRRQGETPLMRQYWRIKDRHPGTILLFRMGDFYETFEADAVIVADVLGITLTRRGNGAAEETPLAGFPHHALDQYLPRLVQAGHRVAVCEQLEDPKLARKIVKRGVVEVVTPGVAFRDSLLTPKHSHYLAAVHFAGSHVGVAFVDASTGEFFLSEVTEAGLPSLLSSMSPAEVLVDKRLRDRLAPARGSFVVTPQEDWVFSESFATETLLRHFQTHSLKGFGVEDLPAGVTAAGAALHYLGETQKGRLTHVRRLQRYRSDDYVLLDAATRRNLELTGTQTGARDGSLIGVLDETLTSMGGRLLRSWLVRPLRDVERIRARLDAVEALHGSLRARRALRDELRMVADLERLCGRVCTGRATPRDVVAIRQTLSRIPAIRGVMEDSGSAELGREASGFAHCPDLVDLIASHLVDEPPAKLDSGGYIREGVSEELDELRSISRGGKEYLAALQVEEARRTGIPSLKVGYNRVFGYYIEITHAHRERVPADYIRKQTLVGAERYVTPALKQYEEKILTAEERIAEIEARLFADLRANLAGSTERLQANASRLARLDVLAALAEVAARNGYVRPIVDDSAVLDIEEGRHPVVERALPPGEPFVPNSVRLVAPLEGYDDESAGAGQIHLVTGPNMAGKSVVLRQTGLIVLLAQVGSFVPAVSARVGVVDALYTRVGASDDLAAGESTFLVEMNETANILNNATARSLVLLDEVGRGTSTFDGLSIAWAVVEHLHEERECAARTLFATHYHELTALADRLDRVKSFRVQVREHAGRVVFLHRLVAGAADHSYGIEVARMAGLPASVLVRAGEVLAHLEAHDVAGEVGVAGRAGARHVDGLSAARGAAPAVDPLAAEILERLRRMDVDRMTPIETMMELADLRRTVGLGR
jgi:DNA mismatch repair protein MutS